MRYPLLIRRVSGASMEPAYKSDQIIIASGWFRKIRANRAVLIKHDAREKLKRVAKVNYIKTKIFVIGDNTAHSTDSRHFGWLPVSCVRAVVIFPKK